LDSLYFSRFSSTRSLGTYSSTYIASQKGIFWKASSIPPSYLIRHILTSRVQIWCQNFRPTPASYRNPQGLFAKNTQLTSWYPSHLPRRIFAVRIRFRTQNLSLTTHSREKLTKPRCGAKEDTPNNFNQALRSAILPCLTCFREPT